jgi:hypothetical protein
MEIPKTYLRGDVVTDESPAEHLERPVNVIARLDSRIERGIALLLASIRKEAISAAIELERSHRQAPPLLHPRYTTRGAIVAPLRS